MAEESPDTFCPQCQRPTRAVEEVLLSSYQFVCEDCGTVVDDSPIQDPGSGGEKYDTQAHNKLHWSVTLGDTAGSNQWAQKILRKVGRHCV